MAMRAVWWLLAAGCAGGGGPGEDRGAGDEGGTDQGDDGSDSGLPDIGNEGELKLDCDAVTSTAAVWIALRDDVVELGVEAGAATRPGDVLQVVGTSPEASLQPWSLQLDFPAAVGTHSCSDDAANTTIVYRDGTAVVWGAQPLSPGSSCEITVEEAGTADGARGRGSFVADLVGFNFPATEEACGAFDVEVR